MSPPQSVIERLRLLAQRRAAWNREHPHATLDEVDAASRAIAEELGL